jgi:hypothetical protein
MAMAVRVATARRSHWVRDEALLMLEGSGAVLETARDISRILLESDIAGAVIDGVSVTLLALSHAEFRHPCYTAG